MNVPSKYFAIFFILVTMASSFKSISSLCLPRLLVCLNSLFCFKSPKNLHYK